MKTCKKKRERVFLEKFLSFTGSLESAEIVQRERPDFQAQSMGRNIGVEVTEYYQGVSSRGSESRRIEKVWNDVLTQVCARLGKSGLDHLTGLVFAKAHEAPTRPDRAELATELTALVRDNAIPVGTTQPLELRSELRAFPVISRCLRRVVLMPTGPARGVEWACATTIAGSRGITDSELGEILNSKKKSVIGYDRSEFTELWLLVVASCDTVASAGEILPEQVGMLARRNAALLRNVGFDKVWYYSWLPEFAVRMYPCHHGDKSADGSYSCQFR